MRVVWKSRVFSCGLIMCAMLMPSTAVAEDRFWIVWENIAAPNQQCGAGLTCPGDRTYSSRSFQPDNVNWLHRMFGIGDDETAQAIRSSQHPEAPKICGEDQTIASVAANAERQFLSDPVDALRGLTGVGLDLRNMRPPPGYGANFGEDLQREFEKRLKSIGLIVLKPSDTS